eukprot:7618549-Prorocentrum_lima.AAC.1
MTLSRQKAMHSWQVPVSRDWKVIGGTTGRCRIRPRRRSECSSSKSKSSSSSSSSSCVLPPP